MPVELPPLLKLGGEEAFAAYRAEFDRLYHAGQVEDVLGRVVEFERNPDRLEHDACGHVCFKAQYDDRRRELPRVWDQERAERMPWILLALTSPYEIRPSHQMQGHQAYLLLAPADPASGRTWERYGVYVKVLAARRVLFLTAFPMEERYWTAARLEGPRLYPPPKKRKKR